jgi:hypothetical protein
MTALRTAPILLLLLTAPTLACRESEARMLRPDFGVLADTLPGGCTDRVCNFRTSGNSAFVSWSTQLSGSVASDTGGGGGGGTIQFGSASVSRGGDPANPQTFFNYGVVECSPFFCNQVAGGFGVIPNADFSAQGRNYRVNTNTAGNPNFFTFAGSPGTITIVWVPNGLFSTRFNGIRKTTQPGFSEQQTGQSDDQSATAVGNVVGFAIGSGNFGSISSTHEVRISITR